MLCQLEAQSFQAVAPLSKVELDPFGHEVFSLISVEEVGGVGGVVTCSVHYATPWNSH